MKFTTNTKPLNDGLDLAIIQSNISSYYQKSCIVELTIDSEANQLRINTEVSSIRSELVLSGMPEACPDENGQDFNHIFVDSMLFKNLMKTIESNTVEFQITETALNIKAKNHKFSLPQVVSGDEMSLTRPQPIEESGNFDDLEQDTWKFVKDHQLYAIGMSFVHPIYNNVWIGGPDDVIVGDFDSNIFTHSTKSGLQKPCLLTDTIINLLTSIPDTSKIIEVDKNYEVWIKTDAFEYICEFTPQYEDEDGVGSYQADMILALVNSKDAEPAKVKRDEIDKVLSQASLFASGSNDKIKLSIVRNVFNLNNINVDANIETNHTDHDFSMQFKIGFLKDAISHMDQDVVEIRPLYNDEDPVGVIVSTDTVSTVFSGVEEV